MSKDRKARASEAATEEQGEAAAAQSGDLSGAEEEVYAQGDGQAAGNVDTAALEANVTSLEQEVADLKDQLLRKQADFENFRKRLMREREDAIRYANTSLLLDLVDTIDNFERAIKSSQDSKDFDTFHTGVDMIEKQLTSMLESKYGLKRFESRGEEFDPDRHEAVTAEESPDVVTQTVIEDFQKGYMLHDRVLRPAKVRVAMPSANTQEADSRDKASEE